MQDCSLNGLAFIQIAPPFLILSEFTPCPNPPGPIYLLYRQFRLRVQKTILHLKNIRLKTEIGHPSLP